MEKIVSENKAENPLVYALASLYTNRNLKHGNDRLRNYLEELAGPDGDFLKYLGRPAGDKRGNREIQDITWRLRGWLRVYYLFHDKSTFFPGRLEKDVQSRMEEMFFSFGYHKSNLQFADLNRIWHIDDSENHDMMRKGNAYLALQAIHKLDAYKDRKLKDGHKPSAHVEAWHKYFSLYALERAKKGLFVEISPIYGKWFLGELVNIYEFSEDPLVRKRMEMLLHLTWADWSVDQVNSVRGGARTRCYPGVHSQLGSADSWDRMASALMGIEQWYWNSHGGLSTLILQTSRYELPDIVLDIVLNKGNHPPFVYQSTRPAMGRQGRSPLPTRVPYYILEPKAGGILRYSYCMPEAVMGSWMVDAGTEYAAINTQNRWQGVVFSSNRESRIFPQSEPQEKDLTFQQHIAVQHRNVMLVSNHPKARHAGDLRVFVAKQLHEKLRQQDGWAIVKEGGTWLAVRALDDQGFEQKPVVQTATLTRWIAEGTWLWPKAKDATVVFVLSSEARHKTLSSFLAYLKSHQFAVSGGIANYTFTDDLGESVKLELGKSLNIPRVNGKSVNLFPEKVFDSPYLNADHGSGVVTITKGQKQIVLDFNKQ